MSGCSVFFDWFGPVFVGNLTRSDLLLGFNLVRTSPSWQPNNIGTWNAAVGCRARVSATKLLLDWLVKRGISSVLHWLCDTVIGWCVQWLNILKVSVVPDTAIGCLAAIVPRGTRIHVDDKNIATISCLAFERHMCIYIYIYYYKIIRVPYLSHWCSSIVICVWNTYMEITLRCKFLLKVLLARSYIDKKKHMYPSSWWSRYLMWHIVRKKCLMFEWQNVGATAATTSDIGYFLLKCLVIAVSLLWHGTGIQMTQRLLVFCW